MQIPKSDVDIIDEVIKREGGLSDDPADAGGLTYKGLSQKANPDLFQGGLPSDSQVLERYKSRYIVGPGFDQVVDLQVRSLLVDWGVNSGPQIAIQGLQEVLGLTKDGVLGPTTLAATNAAGEALIGPLVASRVVMIGRILSRNPSQAKFALGWLTRVVEWLG